MTPTPDRDAHGEEARERLLAEARDVLRPFAEEAARLPRDVDSGESYSLPSWPELGVAGFDVGSLRAARALLDKMEGR